MNVTIQPKGDKGRAFSADLVAYAVADRLWTPAASPNVERPLWAVFAGPSEALRAFVENLRLGNPAAVGKGNGARRFEFLRSAPYRWWTRPLPAGGSCTVAAHPSLLGWQAPVEDAYRYRFLVLPARAWMDAQTFDLDGARAILNRLIGSALSDGIAKTLDRDEYRAGQRIEVYSSKIVVDPNPAHRAPEVGAEGAHALLGYGALLLHYLDHRLPLPLPRDPVFGAWLLLVGHYEGRFTRIQSRMGDLVFHERDADHYLVETPSAAGVAPGFLFNGGSSLEPIAEWLAREVSRWFRVVGRV